MYIRIIAINKMTKCISNYVFNWHIIFKSKDSFPELYYKWLERQLYLAAAFPDGGKRNKFFADSYCS